MKKIDLNVDLEQDFRGETIPSSPNHYPEFSFSESEPCDIPDEGTLTVKFRLVRHAEDTTDPAHPRYSYTVCVKKLLHAVSEDLEAPTKKYDEAGEALDKLAAEKSKEY